MPSCGWISLAGEWVVKPELWDRAVGQVLRWEGGGHDECLQRERWEGRKRKKEREESGAWEGKKIALGSRELRIEFSPCILITSSGWRSLCPPQRTASPWCHVDWIVSFYKETNGFVLGWFSFRSDVLKASREGLLVITHSGISLMLGFRVLSPVGRDHY